MKHAALMIALIAAPAAAIAAEAADPFAGKSLDEIRRMIQTRMDDRKKDSEFAADFRSFIDREDKKASRRGLALAQAARARIGEYMQAEYLFRFAQYSKSLEILIAYEKKNAKGRRIPIWSLYMVYRLMAANYAYVGRAGDASIALGQSRQSGDQGGPVNKIQKIIQDHPSMTGQLSELKRRRDFAPRTGDLQWAVCEFFDTKVFLPLEESIELAWMIKSFPDHPKVKSGDADWALIRSQEKLSDWASAQAMCADFRKSYPNHFACKLGDLTWSLSKALFGLSKYKEAKKTCEQMKIEFPKNHHVESKTVDAFMAECDNIEKSKTPPADSGNQWNQWWEF